MPRYYVEMTVSFSGEIEAANEQQAESLAIYDDTVQYDGVDEIRVTEIEDEEDEEEN